MANKWLEALRETESNRKSTDAMRARRADIFQQDGGNSQTSKSRTAKTDKNTVSVWDTDLAAVRARTAYRFVSEVYPKDAPLEPLDAAQDAVLKAQAAGDFAAFEQALREMCAAALREAERYRAHGLAARSGSSTQTLRATP